MPGHVDDDGDQVPRLARFRERHPDVVILLLGVCPKAWVDGQKVQHPTLRGLLDALEAAVAPAWQAHYLRASR